ncbi:hypothetical protein RB195_002412 [Necator americanus]|uniref:Mos1 transposase HTH domain-containing protein n=1 Tax=Necator americanus TaxID=51031 RepID=A0ABR1DJ75_NECAM
MAEHSTHIRHVFLYEFESGHPAAEGHRNLSQVFGTEAPSERSVRSSALKPETRNSKVNLLYHEPRAHEISQFFEVLQLLTTGERYLLMRADKDRHSLNMHLFFVNTYRPYCMDRYLRMYTYD